ncbi:MAG: hypothetical protein ACM3X4_07165 [Ignavibacteriales bacterium]
MLSLRAYVYIDSLQPQFAAITGALSQGDVPLAGMAALYVEVSPGVKVYPLADAALKASPVRLGFQMVEREFGLLEVHSSSQDDVKRAGEAILQCLEVSRVEALVPRITAAQVISRVTDYQAQLINRTKTGSLLIPGQSLFILETEPAGHCALLANSAEKAVGIRTVDVSFFGAYGRLLLSGTQGEVLVVSNAVKETFDRIISQTRDRRI